MNSRSMLIDKIQDLLVMEGMASEIYRKGFEHSESSKYADTLTRMSNEELQHVELVKKILELLQ